MKHARPTETVFDGSCLRARLTLPRDGSGALYVTFRQWIAQPGRFTDDPPVREALRRGMAHLHLQSFWNDWYLNAETRALEAALRALRPRFSLVHAIGFSMGGYAALRYAAALDLTQALVISPQFSLDRALVPQEDRYPEATDFDPELGDLFRHGKPDLTGAVMFDPSQRPDPVHARLIAQAMPGMVPAPCVFGGHPATQAIRAAGGFASVQNLGLDGNLTAAAVVRLHRSLRARSSRYWHHRAQACLDRGKTAEAERALIRAEALASAEGA